MRWASAVNHLDSERHGTLLAGLASLLGIALPHLESVSGLRLRGRTLQLVVGAFEHSLAPPNAEGVPSFYKVSDWHTDGAPAESIVATATFYVEVSETLSGGAVEYARQAEVWVDDPEATLVVQPASGTLVAFNNALLLHRVQTVSGHGRRRLVAFTSATDAPPQPPATAEALDVAELERRRDESRRRRLGRGGARVRPRQATGTFMRGTGIFMAPASGTGSSYAHGTGVSVPTDDEDEGPVDEEDQSSRHLWALVLEYLDGPPEQEYIDESR